MVMNKTQMHRSTNMSTTGKYHNSITTVYTTRLIKLNYTIILIVYL